MLCNNLLSDLWSQVDSNDKLYGQNKKYLAQVDELLETVLEKIISYLDAIGQCGVVCPMKLSLISTNVYE